MVTRKDIGRPCKLDPIELLKQHICRTRASHGRIRSVAHGIVQMVDQYIDGVATQDNGHYVAYTVTSDPAITVY
jgi:hypothetical protein